MRIESSRLDEPESTSGSEFRVDVAVFQGPFSLLLDLIAKRKLEVTSFSLAQVTDEFVAFVKAQVERQDPHALSHLSEFLVVAATLIELKIYSLLPRRDSERDENLELLEQRDLLFAKLLQYKAFKEAALVMGERMAQRGGFARAVGPDTRVPIRIQAREPLHISRDELARVGAQAFVRAPVSALISTSHLHHPLVSVESQIAYVQGILAEKHRIDFLSLCGDTREVAVVVSRFLALLVMLKTGEIHIEQEKSLGTLYIFRNEAKGEDKAMNEEEQKAGAHE